MIDRSDGPASWLVTRGYARSIDPGRTNRPVTDGYAAFDSAYMAGLKTFETATAAGTDKIIHTNGATPNYSLLNGTTFETFPSDDGGWWGKPWKEVVFGPRDNGPLMDWATRSARQPNLSTVLTYERDDTPSTNPYTQAGFAPNYRKMRYGLTTALMAGGFFSYEIATNGQASLGLMWFDEYDGGGKGAGYLGQPTAPAVAVGAAYRRDFAGGIALVNPSSAAVTVQLGASFRKIKGTQVPSLNDGSLVTAVTIPARDGVVLLRQAPVGSFTLAGGATQVTSAAVTLASSVTGAVQMRVDPGSGSFGAWAPYAASVPVSLAGGYGVNTVRVEYSSSAGSLSLSRTIELVRPQIVPTGDFVANGGGALTTSTSVPVLCAVTNATQMRLRVDSGSWSDWTPYSMTAQVTLPAADGPHTISAEFQSSTGNTLSVSHPVTLALPVLPAGDFVLADGADTTESIFVPVRCSVSDATEMRLRVGSDDWGAWTPYAETAQVTLPAVDGTTWEVSAEFRSRTGDVLAADHSIRAWASEVSAPTGDFTVADGAAETTTILVPVSSAVEDAAEMRFRADGGAWSAWEPYAAATQLRLPAVDGTCVVDAQYRSTTGGSLELSRSLVRALPPVGNVASLVAGVTTRNVQLTWTLGAAQVRPERFEVERRLSTDASWSRIAVVAAPVCRLQDASVANRRTYVYRVRLVDEFGRTGPYSPTATARPRATVERSAGADRTSTATAASRTAFASGAGGGIVIATGSAYADALSAAGLAGAVHGPVLLVTREGVTAGLRDEIRRLGATRAFIVGGTAAVPRTVESAVRGMGLSVVRISGSDRYATAAAVALRIRTETGSYPKVAFVVTGDKFADALSASPVAYALKAPILLTKAKSVPAASRNALGSLHPDRIVIVGGTTVVSSAVQRLLTVPGSSVARVAGTTRYATAAAFASRALAERWASERVAYVVTGANFPDALGAGPAAGERGGLLLLTSSTTLSAPIRTTVQSNADKVDAVEVVGGLSAVSNGVVGSIDAILR